MKVFLQDKETEDVLFRTEDSPVVPAKGEAVKIRNAWYEVVERTFYYKDHNSCTVWVKPLED